MLTKLQFRPGINREVTSYTNEGGWVDSDKVRFRFGFPETIGGWTRRSSGPFLGVCRSLLNWTALSGSSLVGIGTNLKYYLERGGVMVDITPIRLTTDAGDVTFEATEDSDILLVTHVAHGAQVNDFVTFSGALSLGGEVTAAILNAEHQVVRTPSLSTYEVRLSVTANASDTGDGGASTVGAYQLPTGLATSFRGNGWGAGGWGVGGWGEASELSIPGEKLRLWSNTTFGEDLLINPRGGGVYYWDASLGLTNNRAVDISTLSGSDEAPVECNIVALSEQDRHVLAFGCTPLFGGDLDPLLIRFSSQESVLDWNPSATNTAGDLRISSGNQILAVQQTSQQLVVLTDTSAHTLQFIGPPFTFGIREVASGVSVAGPNCAISANDKVYWMGIGEFYVYDGIVREIPCPIKEYVFDLTLDRELRDVVFAAHNSAYSEIWWLYPCTVSGDCTRYAVYNYSQELWYYGTMPRTAWIDRGASTTPIAAGLDGYLYEHETGFDDGSTTPPSPLAAHIQSSPVDLGEGDQFMFVTRMIPDLTFRGSVDEPLATLTLSAQNFPGGESFGADPSAVSRSAVLPVAQFTRQTFVRLRGRAAALRVESNKVGTAWRLGSPRVDVRPDGRR